MTMKFVGQCDKCDQERPVKIAAYPYVAAAADDIIVKVVATCKECGHAVDWIWTGLPELRPDWTEYEKARAEMEAP